MKNLWDDDEAREFNHSDLALRVYSSRLLGRSDDLVLHGGGNTSVKSTLTNIFGEDEEILYVKGSGWDLKTIEEPGFSPARLGVLQRLGGLDSMTDTQMTRELKASMVDPGAPAPSVEAILHALIPLKFVDHTHADAVVAVSNTDGGARRLEEIYGDSVLILPYVMPGFVLAQQVYEATRGIDWNSLDGIVLLHHGIFTFHDDARTSYDNMVKLVTLAEDYLKSEQAFDATAAAAYEPDPEDYLQVAKARKLASELFGYPLLARWLKDEFYVGYSRLDDIAEIATRGPLTPDHSIHTKRIPALLDADVAAGISEFALEYRNYFERNNDGDLTCLDTAPRYAVWRERGCVVFGRNVKLAGVIADIAEHTLKSVQWGEALGGWVALTEREIFDLEYWELEQAKLRRAPSRAEFEGRVAVVTGAASGIGRACAEAFADRGAAVAALDIEPAVETRFQHANIEGVVCDITNDNSITAAVQAAVARFGGIDVLVCNAGSFPPSVNIEDMDGDFLEQTMRVNFSGHVSMMRACTPFLKLGFDPSIVLMSSKNVPAPGPGAGAYSAAKAALTQMGRVAAMELGADGIRVNMLHPNAVFDTGIWSEDVLQKRAASYGLSVEEYKTSNVLQTGITAADVARLVTAVAGQGFAKTTGAQIPIDGGNERVI